ncbi:S-antigen, partial [Plasmodium sp. gorilla clade G1]
MNRILSVTFYLFLIYLYIYKTYGKLKIQMKELSDIYLAKGLFNEQNGKGQNIKIRKRKDDEQDSSSEKPNNDEEN